MQRQARAGVVPHALRLLRRDFTLLARRLEGGDHLVEGVQGFVVVLGHAPLVTLVEIAATRVSATGRVGTISVTLDLGAGVESITLGAEPSSVGAARRFVRNRFAERDLDASVAVLLTSELVSNVVRHARTAITITLRFEPCARIEVHDGAAATEAFREILGSAAHGGFPRSRRAVAGSRCSAGCRPGSACRRTPERGRARSSGSSSTPPISPSASPPTPRTGELPESGGPSHADAW